MERITSRYFYLFTFIILFAFFSYGQDSKTQIKSKKEIEKELIKNQFKATKDLLQLKSFTLEADFFKTHYYKKTSIDRMLNFIQVNGSEVKIQLTSVYGGFGDNGFGGVTLTETISKYKLKTNDKKNKFSLHIGFSSEYYGYFDMFFRINHNGKTVVTIDYGNVGYNFTLYGNLVASHNSIIMKGLD